MSTSEEPPASMLVTPDMLYKLSKKIAQLTKVIYSLNTKNDDLEMDLEHLRSTYEEKLKLAQQQLQLATTNLQQQLQQVPNVTHILRAAFTDESYVHSFSVLSISVFIFGKRKLRKILLIIIVN
jgi:hypothetical protein